MKYEFFDKWVYLQDLILKKNFSQNIWVKKIKV